MRAKVFCGFVIITIASVDILPKLYSKEKVRKIKTVTRDSALHVGMASSLFSSQGSAITLEAIAMMQARQDMNPSWLVHLLFRF